MKNQKTLKDFTPEIQAKIPHGRWYFIEKNGSVLTSEGHWFLDIQDAIELIDDFSAEGNLTIPSNRKLNKNEKQIIVE